MKTLIRPIRRGRTLINFRPHGKTRFVVLRDLAALGPPPGVLTFTSPSNSGLIAAFAA